MDTLLVIGAESTVGANVACTLAESFQVVALSRAGDVELDGCRTIACEFTSAELGRWIDEVSPAWIVFSGALARSSWDEAELPGHWLAAEPHLAAALAEKARASGARLTYISTDAVFAGPQMFHPEDASTLATGLLPQAALAAEQAVIAAGGLVVRTNAYGWSPTEDISFAERFWQALEMGGPIVADAHRHASPILATDLAELLHAAHRANAQGLLHVAGAERTNPRRFAHELAGALGMPRKQPLVMADLVWQRAKETSLICRRAQQSLGQSLPMLREGLRRFVAQLDNGRRDRLRDEHSTLAPAKAA